MGHSKTTHNQLYLYPDGKRYDSLPVFAEKKLEARATQAGDGIGLSDAWGASCAQFFAPMVNDSGFDERYYNNTCVMQSSSQVYSYPDRCDTTSPDFQSVMPYVANNTFYTPSAAPFALNCDVNGTSQKLDFASWQATGQDVGSVQLETTDDTLLELLALAAQLLGMSPPQSEMRVD